MSCDITLRDPVTDEVIQFGSPLISICANATGWYMGG